MQQMCLVCLCVCCAAGENPFAKEPVSPVRPSLTPSKTMAVTLIECGAIFIFILMFNI